MNTYIVVPICSMWLSLWNLLFCSVIQTVGTICTSYKYHSYVVLMFYFIIPQPNDYSITRWMGNPEKEERGRGDGVPKSFRSSSRRFQLCTLLYLHPDFVLPGANNGYFHFVPQCFVVWARAVGGIIYHPISLL